MKNADMPAMPLEFSGFDQYAPEAYMGLTKREHFAAMAMQGQISALSSTAAYEMFSEAMGERGIPDGCAEKLIAINAVIFADALLAELEK